MAHMSRPTLMRHARALVRDERGMSMVIAMMTTFAVFAMGGIWVGVATHQTDSSAQNRWREQAFAAAEAGINEAMSHLTADPSYTGASTVTLPNGAGQYEMEVTELNPTDYNDTRRYITSKGYAPNKTSPHHAQRQLEQQVDLIPTDSFRYALFSAPGGISASNNMTVTGDAYSNTDLTLTNNTKIFGNITSLGSVTTANDSTVGGDIAALGNITIDNSGTTVTGNAAAGGQGYPIKNVTMTGCVKGSVQASGTISGSPPNGCPRNWAQNSPPVAPKAETLPTFVWDPANYPASTTWASPAAFKTYWTANKDSFSGVHRVLCASPCGTTLVLDAKWTMAGDVTIVSDAPVTIDRDIINGTAGTLTLAIISTSSANPAIYLSNNVSTLSSSIHTLFYANNGSVQTKNLKNFTGSIYSKSIVLDNQFTLNWVPIALPGFTWNLASSTHFQIVSRDFKEVPFGS